MRNFLKLSLTLALAVLTLSSCNCFKKMAKNLDEVEVKCTPEVLVLNNGKVTATFSVSFPEDYFNAKAIAKVTPVMVYDGGEVAGTPFYYQGSKVEDNYKVITTGATETVVFDYIPEMRLSTLQLRVEVKCKDEFELINVNTGASLSKSEQAILDADQTSAESLAILKACGYQIAVGVNTLQQDIKQENIISMMANDYKRVTNTTEKADLMYTISSSYVAPKASKGEAIDAFVALVDSNSKNDRATQKLSAQGYASPDGPETFNDKLSKSRSESGKKAMEKLLKDYGLAIDAAAYGEDWDGFKELVQNSDIEDKNLILQVLSLYNSSTQRESEIKNMSEVFSSLKTSVLPQLRRTKMVNSIDLLGKSDEEMMVFVNSKNYDGLNLLEILHISSSDSVTDLDTQASLLEYAANKYNDGTAYNNLGVVYAKQGDSEAAIKAFKAAAANGANSSEVSNNLALAYLMEDNVTEATTYASNADAETKAALAAAQGSYEQGVSTFSGYNKAVACVMTGDYSSAKSAIASCDSADADYLRAVIASKEGELTTAGTQLKSAVSKDSTLAEKASTDVNLANLFESGFSL